MQRSTKHHSDGFYHARITYMLMPLAFCIGMGIAPDHTYAGSTALLCVLGCFLGVFISPDLDLPSLTYSEWKVIRIPLIGRIIGPLFVLFWLPYSFLFKHRSLWSHGPGISTLLRIGYMLLMYWLIQRYIPVLNLPLLTDLIQIETDRQLVSWISLVVGLMVSDIGHWLRDIGILTTEG